jgi:hypothetical protein
VAAGEHEEKRGKEKDVRELAQVQHRIRIPSAEKRWVEKTAR